MMSSDFEEAFSNFLERREYDEAENALFAMVRIAFLAGWKAAGGRTSDAAEDIRADPLRRHRSPRRETGYNN